MSKNENVATHIDVYEEAKRLGIPMDSHESDLYLKDCEASRDLLRRANVAYSPYRHGSARSVTVEVWLDVPFACTPWWDARLKV